MVRLIALATARWLEAKALGGNEREVNLVQVERGMAWFYRQYQREQSPKDRRLYESAEDAAKAGKRGLCHDSELLPPWDFRNKGKSRYVYIEHGAVLPVHSSHKT